MKPTISKPFKSNDRTFDKVYNAFDKRDYFNSQGLSKVQIGNFERALKKNDKGAQQLLDTFKGDEKKAKDYIVQIISDRNKERAFNDYKALKSAVDSIQKGKPNVGAVEYVKRIIHNNNQKYSIALYSTIAGKKLNNYKDIHKDIDSSIGEGFKSDAQRKAAFANGYEEKGKKKNESVNEGKKRYYQQDRVGSAKYTISYHDGKKKHKDGSDFFDIQTFRNKKDLAKFVNTLHKGGYVYGFNESVNEASKAKGYKPKDAFGARIIKAIDTNIVASDVQDLKREGDDNAKILEKGKAFLDMAKNGIKAAFKFKFKIHPDVDFPMRRVRGSNYFWFKSREDMEKYLKKFLSDLKKLEKMIDIFMKKPTLKAQQAIVNTWRREIMVGSNKTGGMAYGIMMSADSGQSIYEDVNEMDPSIKPAKRDDEEVNEGISVFDERHFGKKGIIIMIDDNGKKVSAIFKDKKNADKFNRNKPSDIKKLLQLAKKTKFPKAIDESMNEASREAMGIAALTGTRGVAVQDFIDKNRINSRKLFNALKKANLQGRINFASALAGKPNNPNAKLTKKLFGEDKKEIIALRKKAKSEKAFYDVLDKIEKKYGRRGFEKWLDKSLKDLKINPSKLKTSADKQEALFQAKI